MTKAITMIKSEQLEHHPDNPRKNIGDIEELTASIAVDGILQNLTIVPKPDVADKYYVVIGNRRLEAGRAAGLKEFPCVISDMDYNKQLETMLVENINRSDLTPLEEAEGFKQLTLAGFTVDDIADKTGFSRSTINRRLKIAEYNHDKAQKAIERGGTLDDFARLEKIKSKRDREKLLKTIGTDDFNLELKRTLDNQTIEENKKVIRKALKGVATEISQSDSWTSDYAYDYNNNVHIDLTKPVNEKKLKPKGKGEHFYCFSYQSLSWYKKSERREVVKPKKSKEEKDREKNLRELNKIAKEFYELRADFVKSLFTLKNIKDWQKTCIDAMIKCACASHVNSIGISYNMYDRLKISTDYSNQDKKFDAFNKSYEDHAAGIAAELVYNALLDSKEVTYHTSFVYSAYSQPKPNRKLDVIYDFLVALGYEMSEEEKQYQNGTHPLFNIGR